MELQAIWAVAFRNLENRHEAKVGDIFPRTMALDVMPERLVAREPSLQPYGYAK